MAKDKKIWVVYIYVHNASNDCYTFTTYKRAMEFISQYMYDNSNGKWRQNKQKHWSDGEIYISFTETVLNKQLTTKGQQ